MNDKNQALILSSWAEKRSGFLKVCLLVVCAAIIAVACQRDPVDYDSWWHLKMGQDLVEKGLSPYVDHYSEPFLGEPIRQPPVLFQVGYYYLNLWFGERGGQIAFKLLSYLSLLALFALWLRQVNAPLLVWFVVLGTLVTVTQARMQVRPELVSYSLMVIAFMLYWRARKRFEWRTLLPIALLLLFWVNYHNPIFGFVVIFGLFLDRLIELLRDRQPVTQWVGWLAWGIGIVALGFLRPEGGHFLLDWYRFSPEWRTEILEYRPPQQYLEFGATYLWMASALTAATLSLVMRQWGYLAITAIFLLGGLSMSRMVVPATVALLAINVATLTGFWSRYREMRWVTRHRSMLSASLMIWAITGLILGFVMTHRILQENRVRLPNIPVAAVDYLKSQEVTGPIMNTYHIGGYLLYRMAPGIRVFIDGRTDILYPIDHFFRYKAAMKQTGAFLKETEHYGIDYAILENTDATRFLMAESGFFLEFSDALVSIYRRGDGRLAKLGELATYPYCMSSFDIQSLLLEENDWKSFDPGAADIDAVVYLMKGFLESDNPKIYLSEFNRLALVNNSSRRLFASFAMANSMDTLALESLEDLTTYFPADVMAKAIIMARTNNRTDAIEYLGNQLANFTEWQAVYPRDLELLLVLLRDLDPVGEYALVSPEARSDLEGMLTIPAYLSSANDIQSDHLCRQLPLSSPN